MIYKIVFYDEGTQKIRFTQSTTTDVPVNFRYVGKMNQLELDVLVDVQELYATKVIMGNQESNSVSLLSALK